MPLAEILLSEHLAWQRRANLHRPHDIAGMESAIVDLFGQGLTRRDISDALNVGLPIVVEVLARHKLTTARHLPRWRL